MRAARSDTAVKSSKRRPVSELEAENSRLRAENATLRMERDVLKKATAFFANESR
ncbi:MAG: transposase [Terriglobia bacterium]